MLKMIKNKINNRLESALSKIGIRKLFTTLFLFFGIVTISVFAIATYKTNYSAIYLERLQKLKYVADFAYEIFDFQNSLVLHHQKTIKEAQNDAIMMISKVRFENNDYIWINDYNGKVIYHPFVEKIGTNVKTYVDTKNYNFGIKLVEIPLTKGSGYVEYYWPKINENKNQSFPKISYVLGYKDWNWIIGTGLYIDDIRSKVLSSMLSGILAVLVVIFLMLILFRYITWTSIVIPIENLADKSLKLADNDLNVDIPESNEETEIGHLYSSFHKFVNFFKEKREGEKKLSLIHDNIVDVLVTTDERGNIKSTNPAIEKVFGYNPQEVLNMNMDSLTSPKLFSGNPEDFAGIKYVNDKYELNGIKKSGELFYVDIDLNEIQYDGENFFILLIRDITNQKEVERLKDEFVSVVSHELRTPLTSIRGSLGLLASGIFPDIKDKPKQLVDLAHNNSLRLIDLINDILDIEKIAAGKMEFHYEVINVIDSIEINILINTPYADKFKVNYKLNNLISKNTKINVDKNRFSQILTNLLSNATKFSPENGEVIISTEMRDDFVRISVKDYGPGIPTEFQNKIFSKFTQADGSNTRKGSGTGLGLSICKNLVETMGGKISFETEINKGTTFHIDFPEYIVNNDYIENQSKRTLI